MADSDRTAEILDLLAKRGDRRTLFGYGVRSAADFVRDAIGCPDASLCLPQGQCADEVLKAAAGQLTYSNEDTVATKFVSSASSIDTYCKSLKVDRPPKTLMVFESVITSSKQDRDGDILRTEGAVPDPNMPCLWHHMLPMIPGKMLRITGHDKDSLKAATALVDSELGNDCATLIEFGALRISHGFRPLKFEPMAKSVDPEAAPFPGMLITKFEIMEHSLVSVPSNTDAVITAFSRGKLAQPLVKAWAKGYSEARSKVFPAAEVPAQPPAEQPREQKIITIPVELLEQLCPTCGKAAREAGLTSIKLPNIEDAAISDWLTKAAGDAESCRKQHLNEDGTFKNGFEGCVAAMQECEGHDEDSAQKICAKIAREVGKSEPPAAIKEMPEQMLRGHCDAMEGEEHPFTWCMGKDFGKFEGAIEGGKEKFCAWLVHECTGKWPAELAAEKKGEWSIPKQWLEAGSTEATLEVVQPGKSFPGAHHAKIRPHTRYREMERDRNHYGQGVDALWGLTERGKKELLGILFDAAKFTAEAAQEWLEQHDYKPGEFEAARKEEEPAKTKAACPECGMNGPPMDANDDGECDKCGEKVCPECGRCTECSQKATEPTTKTPDIGIAAWDAKNQRWLLVQAKSTSVDDPFGLRRKYGRVLSSSNESALRQARDMADQCGEQIQAVLDQLASEPESSVSDVEQLPAVAASTPTQKMTMALAEATDRDLTGMKHVRALLDRWITTEDRSRTQKALKELLRR